MPVLVSPTRKLYDLFWAIHAMKEQKPEEVWRSRPGTRSFSCRRRRDGDAAASRLRRVFQAERLRIVVIGERLGIAAQAITARSVCSTASVFM